MPGMERSDSLRLCLLATVFGNCLLNWSLRWVPTDASPGLVTSRFPVILITFSLSGSRSTSTSVVVSETTVTVRRSASKASAFVSIDQARVSMGTVVACPLSSVVSVIGARTPAESRRVTVAFASGFSSAAFLTTKWRRPTTSA